MSCDLSRNVVRELVRETRGNTCRNLAASKRTPPAVPNLSVRGGGKRGGGQGAVCVWGGGGVGGGRCKCSAGKVAGIGLGQRVLDLAQRGH